jgi:hypothetical protein
MVAGFPELIYEVPKKQHQEIEIGPNSLSIDLLRAIYRSTSQPLHTRMRAAMACLKHEVPSLGISVVVNDADIAARLDKAIERIKAAEAKTINGEASAVETKPAAPSPAAPLPAPLNRLYDKRHYRRF